MNDEEKEIDQPGIIQQIGQELAKFSQHLNYVMSVHGLTYSEPLQFVHIETGQKITMESDPHFPAGNWILTIADE